MNGFSAPERWGYAPQALNESPLNVRRRHCACGLDIVADADNPTPEYARHVRTARHQGWWARVWKEWVGGEWMP